MSDIINRKVAIDAICYEWCYATYDSCPHRDEEDYMCDGCDDIKILESLPSAEPKIEWIPVSKKLPDERQDVYVTVLWDDYGDYITAYGMLTQFGWYLYSNAEGELIKNYTVVAWMPLPKPYEETEALTSSSVNVSEYAKWLERIIVMTEPVWICENTPCPEWCEENCNYASIQVDCLRHLFKSRKRSDNE